MRSIQYSTNDTFQPSNSKATILSSGRLHCAIVACHASTFAAQSKKNLPTFPSFSPAANPHKICSSAKKSQVVTFCPKNGSRDLGFLGIMRHSWATSCRVEAPPKSYVTHRADRNPTKQTFYKLLSRISLELEPTGRSVIHVFIVSASE